MVLIIQSLKDLFPRLVLLTGHVLIETVKALLKSNSRITYVPYEKAYEKGFEDMDRRIPDIRKIKKAIGWSPKRTLTKAILDVAEYHRTRL